MTIPYDRDVLSTIEVEGRHLAAMDVISAACRGVISCSDECVRRSKHLE